MKAIIADLYKPKKGEIEVGYYGAVLNLGNEIVELRTKIDNIFELSDLFEIFGYLKLLIILLKKRI